MFKTNDKRDRVSYSDALIAPCGYTLNFAVGSTYSLDLEALTSVCIALGLNEDMDRSVYENPICMLNALQRVSKKMLIFCEAGQIKVNKNPSALSLFLEKMVIPVALKDETRDSKSYPSFHPKAWILQYVNKAGDYHYRFVVLSRNLTFDRSWDVCFSMDCSKNADTKEKTKPIISYLKFLEDQIKDTPQGKKEKIKAVENLCKDLESVSFTTDSKEFKDNFEILPLGIGSGSYNMNKDILLHGSLHDLVVFSPFISGTVIKSWNEDKKASEAKRTLITRKSELTKITQEQSNNFNIYTLKDEVVDGEYIVSDEAEEKQKQDIHGKIYVTRKYGSVNLYLGSMNATYSAINRNVEMMVKLKTTYGKYNGDKFLSEIFCQDDSANPFEISLPKPPIQDDEAEKTNRLEKIIKDICRMNMSASVKANNAKYDIELTVKGKIPNADITITPFRCNTPTKLEGKMEFLQLELKQLSNFYTVEVKEKNVSIRRIIVIKTKDIPVEERDSCIVNDIVGNEKAFIEYVSYVLGDSHLMSVLESKDPENHSEWNITKGALSSIYEKMLRASFEEPERIDEISHIIGAVTNDEVIPDGFKELYDVFKKSLKKRRSK